MRPPNSPHCVTLALALILPGCGEIETAQFLVRPRRDDYASQVQPILEKLGCSANAACHATAQGDLKVVVDPKAKDLDDNYLGVKAKLNLDAPGRSVLIADLLPTSASATADHNPVCFKSAMACSYRKLLAWIAWNAEGDPRPQDIDCTPNYGEESDDPCADTDVQDVCCPRGD